MPGVQKPHWTAPASAKAVWMGWGRWMSPKPFTVVMRCPTAEAARTVNNLAILHARHRQVEAAAREYNRIIGYFDTMESAHPGLYLADLARAPLRRRLF